MDDNFDNKPTKKQYSRRDMLKFLTVTAAAGATAAATGELGMKALKGLEDIRKKNALEQYPQNVREFITQHREDGNTVAVKKDQEGNYRVDILGNTKDHEGNTRFTLYETSYKPNGELLSEGGMATPDFTTPETVADILNDADARYLPLPLDKK